MWTMNNRPVLRILVYVLVVKAGCSVSFGQDAEQEFTSDARPIVIRYDGHHLKLSSFYLEMMFQGNELEADVEACKITPHFTPIEEEQPPGVFAGIASFQASQEIENVQKAFNTIRQTVEKNLNLWLYEKQVDLLAAEKANREELINDKRAEVQTLRSQLESKMAEGTPEAYESMINEMLMRETEKKIQADVSAERTKVLEKAVARLNKQREELLNQRKQLQEQIDHDHAKHVQRNLKDRELELRNAQHQLFESIKKLGKNHPSVVQKSEMLDLQQRQVQLKMEQIKENQRLRTLLGQVEKELDRLTAVASARAEDYESQIMQRSVANFEKGVLRGQADAMRRSLVDAVQVVPELETNLRMLQAELEQLQKEKMQIESRIRNLRPVKVEIW